MVAGTYKSGTGQLGPSGGRFRSFDVGAQKYFFGKYSWFILRGMVLFGYKGGADT